MRAPLERVQNELFDVGADLSVPYAGPDDRLRTTQAMIDRLEALCDEYNAELPELKSFVLPGGTEAAARLHVARAAARRAEIAALEAEVNPLARVYLNRALRPALHPRARREHTRRQRRAALAPRRLAAGAAEERLDRRADDARRRAPRQQCRDADAPVVRRRVHASR